MRTPAKIKGKIRDLERIKETARSLQGIAYDKDSVTSSSSHDQLEKAVIRILEAESRVSKDIVEMQNRRDEAERLMGRLTEPYSSVLYLRYICGMEWAEIATELNAGYSTVSRDYHGRALKRYKELKNNETSAKSAQG